MSDERIWNRQENEPPIWYSRFMRFLLMYPKRSVSAVFTAEHEGKNKQEKTRTNAGPEWYNAAKQWQWEERAEAYDVAQFAEEEKVRQRVYRSGWALDHNRVLTLMEVAQSLRKMVDEPDKVWLPDVKSVGTGPTAERVDLLQFNADLYRELREYLTDISDETGGRTKKTETTLKGLPKVYIDLNEDEDGSVE